MSGRVWFATLAIVPPGAAPFIQAAAQLIGIPPAATCARPAARG